MECWMICPFQKQKTLRCLRFFLRNETEFFPTRKRTESAFPTHCALRTHYTRDQGPMWYAAKLQARHLTLQHHRIPTDSPHKTIPKVRDWDHSQREPNHPPPAESESLGRGSWSPPSRVKKSPAFDARNSSLDIEKSSVQT